jgi:RNA polymerase sigma factor (sigma-70 family)
MSVLSSAMASTPDGVLVTRCRHGDKAAWDELVERFSRYVLAIASQGYGLRNNDAEDVFQDVFVRVWERLDTLRDDEAFRPWLAQLTRRCCVDHLRAGGREGPVAEIDEQATLDVIETLDEALAVRDALARLGPDCREILDRFFARDESYRTIGEALDLPSGTIASRISRCLAKLREQLEAPREQMDGRKRAPDTSREQVTR